MKKLYGFLLVCGFAFSLTGCALEQQNTGRNLFNESGETLESVVYGEDLNQNLLDANRKDPLGTRITNLEELAKFYIPSYGDEEDSKKLMGVLQKLDATNPQNSDYLMGMGFLSIAQEKNEQGYDYFQQAYNNSGNFSALVNKALYAKARGDGDVYQETKKVIEASNNTLEKAKFADLDKRVNHIKEIQVNTSIPDNLPEKNHLFVLLGYALNEDGTMQETLVERLKVAKEALEKYPNSKIIVTGGVEKNGNTESKLMAEWLEKNGIQSDRIIQENMARDTVENCLYSLSLIEQENDVRYVTVISSATHIQRAVSLFELVDDIFAKRTGREPIKFTNVSWLDVDKKELEKPDMFGTTRDLLRTDGYWMFPGLSR